MKITLLKILDETISYLISTLYHNHDVFIPIFLLLLSVLDPNRESTIVIKKARWIVPCNTFSVSQNTRRKVFS